MFQNDGQQTDRHTPVVRVMADRHDCSVVIVSNIFIWLLLQGPTSGDLVVNEFKVKMHFKNVPVYV